MFKPVSNRVSFPEVETDVLQFWQDASVFERSLDQRKDAERYVFYDGPPFATGLPHYGHLLASAIKDVIPQYQTMLGKYVGRTFGWDCHGLPVENEMEKELGISSKHEIDEYGVAEFNESCRNIVLRYTGEWETIINRLGRWVDFRNGYRTMDLSYMESIWWVFKQLWERDLIYEGHKILPYCPRCATPLSNFEANQGYEEVQDPSITVRFQSEDEPGVYFLAWTTTPWTLPSNLALAVHPDITYVRVQDGDVQYILAEARVPVYYGKELPEIVEKMPGRVLTGKRYKPLFPYFADRADEGAFRLLCADFVTTDNGSGIVHVAPGFGEDDSRLGQENDLPVVCPVDAECRFDDDVADYSGRPVKETDRDIIQRLKAEGKLVHRSTYQHSYPHCWRCEAPLIYRAVSTWFVHVEAIKSRMLKANEQIHWVPGHLREGRFGKWLANAHDWAISRNRYWGCPLPVWRSEDGAETVCIGSVQELEERSGRSISDIHKHFVDEIELPSQEGNGALKRIPEVLDCWFESGSMPYAEHHYPFEHKEHVEAHFPADFIAEGLDQTRGWFYTLVVIGAALFDRPPFKNVIVNGLVLAEDGRKMSKRLKNYPDPLDIMNTYGADALRLCLLSSPVVRAEDLRFSENAVRESMRTVILPLWNAYSFLVTYARVDGWEPSPQGAAAPEAPENVLDRWVLSRLQGTVAEIRAYMDDYDLQRAANQFTHFIDDLTNWYIRRSRRRFWKSENDADKSEAYATLHYVLVSLARAAAPFIPFVTEEIYCNLRTDAMPESVHLCDYPTGTAYVDTELDDRMGATMTAVSLGRYLRTQASLRIRQPLRKAVLVSADPAVRTNLENMASVIGEELNVKSVDIRANEQELVHLSAKANFKALGPRLGKRMRDAATAIAKLDVADIEALRGGDTLSLDIPGGDPVTLTADDVIVQRSEKPGLTVANEGAITVALDTQLDDKLVREGWAREIVSRLQNMRKEADLDVTDRIRVRYDLPEQAEAALRQYADYVAGETLAEELEPADLREVEPVQLNNLDCRFQIARADGHEEKRSHA